MELRWQFYRAGNHRADEEVGAGGEAVSAILLYCSHPMIRRRKGQSCGYVAKYVVLHSSYLRIRFVCGYHARAYTNVVTIAAWAAMR